MKRKYINTIIRENRNDNNNNNNNNKLTGLHAAAESRWAQN